MGEAPEILWKEFPFSWNFFQRNFYSAQLSWNSFQKNFNILEEICERIPKFSTPIGPIIPKI